MPATISKLAITILSVAREGRDQGATVSEISRMIYKKNIVPGWPDDGSTPKGFTLRSEFARVVEKLAKLNFISLEDISNDKAAVEIAGLDGLDHEHAKRIRIKVREDFSLMQSLLNYSLSEHERRGPNSMVISPPFNLNHPSCFETFAIMPFAPQFDSIYQQAILPACSSMNLTCGRGDDFAGANYIIDDVWTALYHAKIIIADCTKGNSNVFYELGIAHLLSKDVVIITQSKEDIPFDIAHRRYLLYDSSKLDTLKNQITKEIKHLLNSSSRERLSE